MSWHGSACWDDRLTPRTTLPPTVGKASDGHRQLCAKNQNQIITACIAYSGDFDTPWPIGVSASTGFPIRTGDQARLITARSFEVLAATMSLPNGLFRCKSSVRPAPTAKPRTGTTDDSWGGLAEQPSYAFDWAAPGDPSAIRVMTADRTPANHRSEKGELVHVCFGDGHTRTLKVRNDAHPAGRITAGHDGSPAAWVVENPDALGTDDERQPTLPDNLFDDVGDGGVDDQGRPYDPLAHRPASVLRLRLGGPGRSVGDPGDDG